MPRAPEGMVPAAKKEVLNGDNDLLVFMDEPEESSSGSGKVDKPWKVLIVDDEKQIHAATRFALKGVVLLKGGLRSSVPTVQQKR